MEPNDTNPHPHPHHHHHPFTTYFTTATTAASSPCNAPVPQPSLDPTTVSTAGGVHHQPQQQLHPGVYPTHSVGPSSAAGTSAPVERRKRGRPRKYVTPEQALAAKKAAPSSSSSHHHSSSSNKESKTKRGGGGGDPSPSSTSYSSKKSQKHFLSLGNVGLGFTLHIINAAAGEDVGQKLMMFVQQSRREMCILSASGTISNVSLRQPATSGGGMTYEGQFEIISLTGSYIHTDIGERSGGLSVCLSSSDGKIIGGGVGGPLKAAGPVQVIVGTFLLDQKKDTIVGVKGDGYTSKLPSPVGGMPTSTVGFHLPVDSSVRSSIHRNDEHQNMGGNPFMIQHHGMLMAPARPTDWRDGTVARTLGTYDFSGRTGHGGHQSLESSDYEELPD